MKRLFAILVLASFFSASIQSCGPKKEVGIEEEKTEAASAEEDLPVPEVPAI